ncbi:MAG: hypothetical protein HC854_08790 [Flavobacterium sp.]|nr:hypothetical protein [Flavobacterium sp.]
MYYYDKTFEDFDFIFVKDAINAAQIAYFSKKDYKKYLIKGFDYGLKLDHLRWIKLFEPDLKKLLIDKNLIKEHTARKKEYLKKIDLEYLNTLYIFGIQDQLDKQTPNRRLYDVKKRKSFLKIEEFIREKGFPGEKLLGIQDSTVFKDSNSKYKDLYERIKKYKKLYYFKSDDQILSQEMIYLLMIHNFCSYNTLEDIWLKEIKKGNVHPRDVALLHDNIYRGSTCNDPKTPYKNNLFVYYTKYSNLNKEINNKRAKLFITSLEIDQLKIDYEQNYGFKFFWGFWSCR